jgi:hypothetical protein
MEFLVSIESRYVVKADDETQAKALAMAAASCCGVEAPGIADCVECRGSDLICCTEEGTTP